MLLVDRPHKRGMRYHHVWTRFAARWGRHPLLPAFKCLLSLALCAAARAIAIGLFGRCVRHVAHRALCDRHTAISSGRCLRDGNHCLHSYQPVAYAHHLSGWGSPDCSALGTICATASPMWLPRRLWFRDAGFRGEDDDIVPSHRYRLPLYHYAH